MPVPKKYFHDKFILFLLTVNIFLTFLCIALIIWQLTNGHTGDYIVQYHSNLGLNQFTQGNVVPILSFIVFALGVLVVHGILSIRAYDIQRYLSVVILGFGTLLLLTATIVSNALLALH